MSQISPINTERQRAHLVLAVEMYGQQSTTIGVMINSSNSVLVPGVRTATAEQNGG